MTPSAQEIRLEVLIATYGTEGLKRLCNPRQLERTPAVRYLISVQSESDRPVEIPTELSERDDISVCFCPGKGLSRNRNHLLENATAPYLMLADDDIEYRGESLKKIIHVLDENPTVDIATFQIKTGDRRRYPEKERDIVYRPFKSGFYPCSVEIALRRESVILNGLRFDTRFGLNGDDFCCGEEDVFLFEAFKRGLKARFFPIDILEHPHPTSDGVRKPSELYIVSKGAVIQKLYGKWAGLRRLKMAFKLPGGILHNMRLLKKGALKLCEK